MRAEPDGGEACMAGAELCYTAGGARGAILRGTTSGTETTTPETSSRLIAGAISTIRDGVGTAVPAAEQIGQTCESSDREFRSTQQCSCPARRMPPRRSATKRNRFDFAAIVPVFVRLA